jgi:hypothetical protein
MGGPSMQFSPASDSLDSIEPAALGCRQQHFNKNDRSSDHMS